jgi:regulator of cell morphogenesis and NO signaling
MRDVGAMPRAAIAPRRMARESVARSHALGQRVGGRRAAFAGTVTARVAGMLDPNTPVATLVLDHSECAPVFARHRIDYCCKGQRPLADACRDLGLEVSAIVDELDSAISRRNPGVISPDLRKLSTHDLILKAIAPHHQYLHRTMPFLQGLAAKVARVHGEREPSLREVASRFDALVETLNAHLAEEERVLFPALLAGRVDGVVSMLRDMKREHEEVGVMLAGLRGAARDHVVPEWGCTSYRTLMAELAALEADVLVHVHIENHVLLPRYITHH